MLGLIASIRNIKQNIQENIVQCWFFQTSLKILDLVNKAQPPLLLICRQNFNAHSVKTNTVIYYYLTQKSPIAWYCRDSMNDA